MPFTCQNCKRELSIYILSSSLENARETKTETEENLYCSYCKSYQKPERDTFLHCDYCGFSYNEFIENGSLSCANCYESFAPKLERFMERYQQKIPGSIPFSKGFTSSSLAKARSQELCEYILKSKTTNETSSGVIHKQIKKQIKTPNQIAELESKQSVVHKGKTVQSLRIRIARNIENLPYLYALTKQQKQRLSLYFLSPQTPLLLNWHPKHSAQMNTNDEDHLRIHWCFPWQDENRAIHQAKQCFIDVEKLDELYQWQFHPDYGLLTASPYIGGLAMRISFELHMPNLFQNRNWPYWQKNIEDAGCEIRGVKGETGPLGNTIQISNRHWPWDTNPEKEFLPLLRLIEHIELAEQKE